MNDDLQKRLAEEEQEEEQVPKQGSKCIVLSIIITALMTVATFLQFQPASSSHLYH
jgi:hypothetical protein